MFHVSRNLGAIRAWLARHWIGITVACCTTITYGTFHEGFWLSPLIGVTCGLVIAAGAWAVKRLQNMLRVRRSH